MQKEALESFLKSRGKISDAQDSFILASDEHIYIDEGISGTTPLSERPAFARLQEDILCSPEGKKPFDVVVVYKIDRFARKLKILLEVIDFFEEYDIKFISINESIDTSSPFGRAILGIIGVIAELERETITERTSDGKLQAIKKGGFMGGVIPYGYIKDEEKRLIRFESEAEMVEMIFDMFVREQKTTYEIARILTKDKYPSPQASAVIYKKTKASSSKKNPIEYWRSEQIKNILGDEVYRGKYYHGKSKNNVRVPKSEWKLSPAGHEAIIDKLTFSKAQSRLKELTSMRKGGKRSKDEHVYLLSGLLRCDCCYDEVRDERRYTWTGDRKEIEKGLGNYTYSYKCGRKNKAKSAVKCSSIPLPAKEVEEYVVKVVKDLLQNPVAVYEYQRKLASTKQEIKVLQTKQNRLLKIIDSLPNREQRLKEQHEIGAIDTQELKKKLSELKEQQSRVQSEYNENERKISENALSKGYTQTLELFSDKYTKALENAFKDRKQTHEILRMLIDEITVYTRPIEKEDSIAGRKSKDQEIPCKIRVRLKLPQDILNHFSKDFRAVAGEYIDKNGRREFGVNSNEWWIRWDSNPGPKA